MATKRERAWDEQRCKEARVVSFQDQMKRHNIGAFLLGGHVGARWTLGVPVPSVDVFVPPEGEVIGFVRQRDIEYVRMHHANMRLPLYEQDPSGEELDKDDRWAYAVAALMEEHGVAGERLGVEEASPGLLLALLRRGVRVVDAGDVFEQAMALKNEDELMMYREVIDQYAHTMRVFQEAAAPGVTETALAGVVETTWHEAGGEDISQLNVCSGENMNPWRRWPSDRALKSGEFVGIDLHARGVTGLRGDVSRTYLVGGRPTKEQRSLYRGAYEYVQAAMPIFKAGRTFAEIAEAQPPVPAAYQQQQFSYSIAHGAGMGFAGYPHIEPHNHDSERVIEPNHILSIECHFGEVGSSVAVKLEDMILVGEGEPEWLTKDVGFDDRLLS